MIDSPFHTRNDRGMTPLFKEIERHLEYYGYQVRFEDGVLKASHLSKPIFWVHSAGSGALFIALYVLGSSGKSDRLAVLEFVNKGNRMSVISRFVYDADYMTVNAWIPGNYGKDTFSEFFDQYMRDIFAPANDDSEMVKRLFWEPKPSTEIPGLEG